MNAGSNLLPCETGPASFRRAFPSEAGVPRNTRPRLDAIDLLRGLVMIVMVLDHTRDFVGGSVAYPRDVHDAPLFLTRWITHFCAPTFVFLAGVSAFLYEARGRTKAEVSRFLLTRGFWLIALELTVIKFATTFSVRPDFFTLQVIWAIGCAMVALSALVFLPRLFIGAFALLTIGGHNLLDSVRADTFGPASWMWHLLHAPTMLKPVDGTIVFALYPLVPWIAVLAAGYAFGPVMLRMPVARRRILLTSGISALALFIVLRTTGIYGDPAARVRYDGFLPTLLSFLNCEKYPPSLQYLCMTLGPALIFLSVSKHVRGRLADFVITFGRVPMFYYVAHLFVVHALAVIYSFWSRGDAAWLFGGKPVLSKPEHYGVSLPLVYVAWIGVVAALYFPCRWFARLKQRRNDWWLSYL
jgi:uncharacterized membrane protein